MKNFTKFCSFSALIAAILIFSCVVTFAQNNPNEATKENVDFKRTQNVESPSLANNTKKITSEFKMMKNAEFSLYSFPMKNTNYLSVKSAIPNQTVKVLVYDVSGKVIYDEKVPTGNYGEFVIPIDPRVDFVPGDCFIAALYNNQVFYETIDIEK